MVTPNTQRILVTGGTGFTGAHLVRRLLERGHEVIVLDHKKGSVYDELISKGARIVIGSITDKKLVESVVEGCDTIQHIAAAFREINVAKSLYWDVNVNGTRNLLEAATKYEVKRFVYCSTCGVHGVVKNPPASEVTPIAPVDYYQYTKFEGEKVAQEYIRSGLSITILRPAAIFGPEDPGRWLMLFKRVASGRFYMFGNGIATYHPLYIDNLTDAFELAMDKEEAIGQTYLIADDYYYTLNDLVVEIGSVLGQDIKIIHLPFTPLWITAAIIEAICKPFRIKPPIFRRRVNWFRQNRAFDISKAKRELGYNPKVDLRTGLEITANWYIKHGYLSLD
jgi:nucleoside-diphosphate-sugar epimerase